MELKKIVHILTELNVYKPWQPNGVKNGVGLNSRTEGLDKISVDIDSEFEIATFLEVFICPT